MFCLAALGVVLFKAEFPLLLFLSLSGLQKKTIEFIIISGLDIASTKNLTVSLYIEEKKTQKYPHGHGLEISIW